MSQTNFVSISGTGLNPMSPPTIKQQVKDFDAKFSLQQSQSEDVEELKKQLQSLQLEVKIKNDQIKNQDRTQLELTQQNQKLYQHTKELQQMLYYKQQQIDKYKTQNGIYKTNVGCLEKTLQILCEDISKQEGKKKILLDLNQMKSELIELREALMRADEANNYTSPSLTNLDLKMQESIQDYQNSISPIRSNKALQNSSNQQIGSQQQQQFIQQLQNQQQTSLQVLPDFNGNFTNTTNQVASTSNMNNLNSLSSNNIGNNQNNSNFNSNSNNLNPNNKDQRKYYQIHQQNSTNKFEYEVMPVGSQQQIPVSQMQIESVDNLEERKENSVHASPSTSEQADDKDNSQKLIQKILSDGDPDYSKNFILLKWLSDTSSEFNKIKMVYYNNYRGVHARQKIKKGECILFIPVDNMITLELSKELPICQLIESKNIRLLSPKHTFLSIYIIIEKKNHKSFWKPFLDILPVEYTTFPILYTDEELFWLKGSPFLNQVKERRECITQDYQAIVSKIAEFAKLCTLDEFAWARMMAASRIYGLFINKKRTDAFVPLADMFNHRRPAYTNWGFCEDKGGFMLKASEDIRRGDQIYYSCGRKCNSRFLLNYGFVVKNNEANEIQLRVDFDKKDETLPIKLQMIGKRKPESLIFRIHINYEEKSVLEFFGFMRFVLIRDYVVLEKFHEMSEGKEFDPLRTPPFSIENEKQMWSEIHKICAEIMIQYPTTLDEDKKILETSKLTINQKNCVILRMGEKEILMYYITMADRMKKLLTMTKTEVKKHILQNQEYTKYSSYVNGIVLSLLTKRETYDEE
ncbi:hypothetical protein ABPG72_012970 [Tetrahymena utriculariae]